MGFNGACRREELTNMSIDDIEYNLDSIMVSVPKTKNNVPRMFAITEGKWIELIKKYAKLRPENTTNKRFFLTYRSGKCVNCPMGINTIGKVPREIAKFLKLINPELFTGHCFRRSSATHLANCGGDLLTLKHHGGWKSSAVAESYVDASLSKRIEVAEILASHQSPVNLPGCSRASQVHFQGDTHENPRVLVNNNANNNIVEGSNIPGVSINAQDTANVVIHVYNNCTFQGHNNLTN